MINSPTLQKIFINKTNSSRVQFFRYVLVGVACTIADYTVLVTLTEGFNVSYLISAYFGFAAGFLTNYIFTLLWVFNKRRINNKLAEFSIYLITGLGGMLLNGFIIWLLTDHIHMHYAISKAFSIIIVYLSNFFIRKYALFN